MKKRSFGGFEGCFQSRISDEEEKLNLAALDGLSTATGGLIVTMRKLFNDKGFEFLFEHEDSNRVRVTPDDVLIYLKDWMDMDETQSAFSRSGPLSAFVNGTGDENYPYDQYNPRYHPKNAFFDSLDELYMVHGVNDAFMTAFRDRLTIYPDKNSKINVNTDDDLLLYVSILSAMDPNRPDPRILDPAFRDDLIRRIRAARVLSVFGMSVKDFVNVLQTAGLAVDPSITGGLSTSSLLGDKSTTYTIKSQGSAGAVEKTITATVRLNDGLGRLVYWKEE
jgi:general secretion pathway protein K